MAMTSAATSPCSPSVEAKQEARRTCLACGRPFRSEGPWNRICSRCARKNARRRPGGPLQGKVTPLPDGLSVDDL